jgi:hypothetical protein
VGVYNYTSVSWRASQKQQFCNRLHVLLRSTEVKNICITYVAKVCALKQRCVLCNPEIIHSETVVYYSGGSAGQKGRAGGLKKNMSALGGGGMSQP